MRDYELTYIIKPDLDAATTTSLIERVNGFIAAEGGTVAKTNQWGVRHLAYPIRKYREGYYVFSVVQLEATALGRIEQRLRLLEDVMRYLLVRADEAGEEPTGEAEVDVMGGEAVEAVEPVGAGPATEASASTSASTPATEPTAEATAETPMPATA